MIGTTCTPLATSAPASAAEGLPRGTPHRSTPAGRVCQRHLCYVLSVRNAIWMLLRRRNHEWCRYVPSSQSADTGSVFCSCSPMLTDKNTWVEKCQKRQGVLLDWRMFSSSSLQKHLLYLLYAYQGRSFRAAAPKIPKVACLRPPPSREKTVIGVNFKHFLFFTDMSVATSY